MLKNISVGTNLFAYCCNDSVNNSDPNGFSAIATGGAMFYYFVNYVLPQIIVYSVLFISGVLLIYILIKIVTDALNNSGSSGASSNNPKKPDNDSKIKKILKKIPNSLKKDGKVDLSKFNKKVRGENAWKSSNGWKISKDTANHGGRVWKLFDKAGKRIASLGADGSVLSK